MQNLLFVSSILLWILMFLNILLTIGLAKRISRQFPKMESLKVGQSAPDFKAWTLDGEPVTRASYDGQSTAFVFMSPHCDPCRDEIPKLEMLRPQAEAHGHSLILVSNSEESETRAFLKELGSTLPVLVAPHERTSFLRDYKFSATPSYCFVGRDGKVKAAGVGVIELNGMLSRN
jgi:peroxiredoxin